MYVCIKMEGIKLNQSNKKTQSFINNGTKNIKSLKKAGDSHLFFCFLRFYSDHEQNFGSFNYF